MLQYIKRYFYKQKGVDMIMKKLSAAILSLMVMTQVVQARNNAALFGVAAAAIAGVALMANSHKTPRRHYSHHRRHKKKHHKKAPIIITDEMRIQRSLTYLEFYKGSIDGKLNSYASRKAIKKLNQQYGISQGTTLKSRTWDQLIYLSELFEMDKYLFEDATTKTSRGKQLQSALKAYGVYDDKIDGIVGSGTKRSIARYKEQQGLGRSAYLSSNERYNLIDSAQKMNADNINQAIKELSPASARVPRMRATPTNVTHDNRANMSNDRDFNQNRKTTPIPNNSRTIPTTREVTQTSEVPRSSSVNTQAPATQEAKQSSPNVSSNQKDLEEMERALNSIDKE